MINITNCIMRSFNQEKIEIPMDRFKEVVLIDEEEAKKAIKSGVSIHESKNTPTESKIEVFDRPSLEESKTKDVEKDEYTSELVMMYKCCCGSIISNTDKSRLRHKKSTKHVKYINVSKMRLYCTLCKCVISNENNTIDDHVLTELHQKEIAKYLAL